MVSPHVYHAQAVAGRGKIEVNRMYHRLGRVFEIYGDYAAPGGGHLIHEAAGLAEKAVLRRLAHYGQVRGIQLLIAKQPVDHGAHEYLESRRRGQAAALHHLGSYAGVKAPDLIAPAHRLTAYAPHQRRSAALLRLHRLQFPQVYLQHIIALGFHPDSATAVFRGGSNYVRIHRARQHLSPLVVSVVAPYLGAPGCGINYRLGLPKQFPESAEQLFYSFFHFPLPLLLFSFSQSIPGGPACQGFSPGLVLYPGLNYII